MAGRHAALTATRDGRIAAARDSQPRPTHTVWWSAQLTQKQLRNLAVHKYTATGRSILEDLLMQRFWNAVVTRVPLWVAPNLLTMLGLVVNVLTSLVIMLYLPTTEVCAPRRRALPPCVAAAK